MKVALYHHGIGRCSPSCGSRRVLFVGVPFSFLPCSVCAEILGQPAAGGPGEELGHVQGASQEVKTRHHLSAPFCHLSAPFCQGQLKINGERLSVASAAHSWGGLCSFLGPAGCSSFILLGECGITGLEGCRQVVLALVALQSQESP